MRANTFPSTCSLKFVCLLVCLGLTVWQSSNCIHKFLLNPVVTSTIFEKFSDTFLPEITVCPVLYNGKIPRNQDELAKHGLTLRMYLRDMTWKGNSTLTAEELQTAISWKLDDLIASIGWKMEGDNWRIQQVDETMHQWTSTTWGPNNWGCWLAGWLCGALCGQGYGSSHL